MLRYIPMLDRVYSQGVIECLCRGVWSIAAGELGSCVDGAESGLIDGAERKQ